MSGQPENYMKQPAEKSFIDARDSLSNTTQNPIPVITELKELPATPSWAYALAILGNGLAQNKLQERRQIARGQVLLRLAARKMEEGFQPGDTHTLLYDYIGIVDLQVDAGDLEGAQKTARSVEPHLATIPEECRDNRVYGRTLQHAHELIEAILTPPLEKSGGIG